jgi:hypothetical protein
MSGKPFVGRAATLISSVVERERILIQRYGGTRYWNDTARPFANVTVLVGYGMLGGIYE